MVMGQAQAPQLAAHDGGVLPDGDGRVLAGVDGVLLRGQPEGVEAERVQHMMTGHAQVPAEHVGADVPSGCPRAARCRWGREEVQQVELGPARPSAESGGQGAAGQRAGRVGGAEGPLPFPALLPAQLDLAGQPRVVPERRSLLVHGSSRASQETKKPLTHEGLPR